MEESKNITEMLPLKTVGYFLALIAVFLFFLPLAYLTSFIYNGSSEPLASKIFYIIVDLAEMAAAVTLCVISAKILRA